MAERSTLKALLKLTKHSTIYGVGHVLTKSLSILLLPIHTNFVNKFEYGIATQLFTFLAITAIIYSYGLNIAYLQFYIQEKDREKKHDFFSTAFFATLMTSMIFSTILFLLRKPVALALFDSSDYHYLVLYSVAILTFDALALLSINIFRAEEKTVGYAFFSVANVAFNLIFNIFFVGKLSLGVKGIFLANIFSSALIFLLMLPFTFKRLRCSFSAAIYKKMLRFGLPFIPATMSIVVMNSIDRIFIKEIISLEASGIYGAGYKLGLIVKLFINAFQFAWIPFFISTAIQENAKEIFSKILTYFALICGVLFLVVTMYINQIVRFKIFGFTIFGEEYWGSTQIVPLVTLAYIAYGFYLNFLVGIYLKEKTKLLVVTTGTGAIINILGNLLLIPKYGIMGAACATVFSYLSMTFLIYFISRQYYYIKYEFQKIAKIGIICVFIYLIYAEINLPFEAAAKILLVGFYFILAFFLKIFEPGEIDLFRNLLSKKISKR